MTVAAQADDEEERELVAVIHTRRRRKCIAQGAHPEHGQCARCGL